MENELVASKLDCNQDDQPIGDLESLGRASVEVELECNTSSGDKVNETEDKVIDETEEEVECIASDLKHESVDQENNIETETQPQQQETEEIGQESDGPEVTSESSNNDEDERHPPVEFR